jgi:hypothetical protein
MEGLGYQFNVAPIASGAAVNLRKARGVTFICTGNDTFTLTASATFTGSYATPGNIVTRTYTNTSTDGTAAWVKVTQAASNAVTISSGTVAFYVDGASLPDGIVFVKCTKGSAGLVTAVLGELYSQRQAANLPAISAA